MGASRTGTGRGGAGTRRIHPDHQAVVDRLEARYADQGLRFATGFAGWVPVQAEGRLGRHLFYFRFRSDVASLRVGKPDLRGDASAAKKARVRALRTCRRLKGEDVLDRFFAELPLHRRPGLESPFPSIVVRHAAIHGVTGDPYAGTLGQDEAEELFIRLMGMLEAPTGRPVPLRKALRRGYTPPMGTRPGIIRKRPKR